MTVPGQKTTTAFLFFSMSDTGPRQQHQPQRQQRQPRYPFPKRDPDPGQSQKQTHKPTPVLPGRCPVRFRPAYRILRGDPPEDLRHRRCHRLGRKIPKLSLPVLPGRRLLPKGLGRRFPVRKTHTGFLQRHQTPFRLCHSPFRRRHLCHILQISTVVQRLRMLPKVFHGPFQSLPLPVQFLGLIFQPCTARQPFFQSRQGGLRLRQQALTVILAPVPKLPEPLPQCLGTAMLVTCGHQRVQPGPQIFILRHRHIRGPDQTGPDEHAPLHAQQHLSAVVPIQSRHRQACVCLEGPEGTHGHPSLGTTLDRDVPPLPLQVDPAGHRRAGPGLITLLVRQLVLFAPLAGIQPIEHGGEEGAPCGLAPFVWGFDHVQPRPKLQRSVLQLAEGGTHRPDPHGSSTSRPSRICREIRAASSSVFRSSVPACSIADRRIWK